MKNLYHTFRKFVTSIVHLQEIFGTILLAIFFIAILIQIIARYSGIAILWTEELANYTFIWAVFMGASAMVFHRAHFSFTFFKDRFRGVSGAYYNVFISCILLCFTLPMIFYGAQIVDIFWHYNWITLPDVQMGYTWLCIPIMGATMSLYIIFHIITDLRAAAAVNKEEAVQ